MNQPYSFNGFVSRGKGHKEPIAITVSAPAETADKLYRCEIRTELLAKSPFQVYSGLAHDAWALAFEILDHALRLNGAILLNGAGEPIELPAPPRDRSWVGPSTKPNVLGIAPIYRTEGWATTRMGQRQRVELAIWPPFEEETDTYCAPTRCSLRREGEVMCSYGASPEHAVYLAYRLLQVQVEFRKITNDEGRPLEIPVPPEPP